MTAISVDRLFALFLGIRYKQIVTLKRTNISFAGVWVLSEVPALCYISYYLITIWFGYIDVSSYMVISVVSYTKIFCSFRHHNALVHTRSYIDHRSSHPNLLKISRYRKAVYRALWVQLALAVCYLPFNILIVVARKTFSSHIVVTREIAIPYFTFLQLDVKSVPLPLEDF